MTNSTDPKLNLGTLLEPVRERHAELVRERDDLQSQLDAVREEIGQFERILKAGGVMEREPRKPQQKKAAPTPTSPATRQRVLDFVNTHDEVISTQVAEALGLSQSYSGKALAELRQEDKIRLVRNEPSSPDGRGHRPVYGPWKGGDDR